MDAWVHRQWRPWTLSELSMVSQIRQPEGADRQTDRPDVRHLPRSRPHLLYSLTLSFTPSQPRKAAFFYL